MDVAGRTLRMVGLAAAIACAGGCGGGGGGGDARDGGSMPVAEPAPAPALQVGPALAIDDGATGNPVMLRVARSANGDGFAVWLAYEGKRRDVWANRYTAASGTWGRAVTVESRGADIDDLQLAVDPRGNATVIWHEIPEHPQYDRGPVVGAHFDAATTTWRAPVTLNPSAWEARLASDASGAVLAVYIHTSPEPGPYTGFVRGRFLDPASGEWQPEMAIEQNHRGIGYSYGPWAALDGRGNAFAGFSHSLNGELGIVASNYYDLGGGGWGQLPLENTGDVYGTVPGSFPGPPFGVRVTPSADGNFLVAWESPANDISTALYLARFISRTRTWDPGGSRLLVPKHQATPDEGNFQAFALRMQGLGSDARGNALVLWTEGLTENCTTRTALHAMCIDPQGQDCSTEQVIDRAVGGGAGGVELAVDPQGDAIAIWQRHRGRRPDNFAPSNIAINRFDASTRTWEGAVLAETRDGDALSPGASAIGGQALLGWIEVETGGNRVKALLQPLPAAANP